MDYLGNEPEYYQTLLAQFCKELVSTLVPLSVNDTAKLKGVWKVEGINWDSQDLYEFDGVEVVKQSESYEYYKIPANGILSLYYHYDAMPEYDVEEGGYAEEAFYAHWVDGNTIHLSNPDSSLRWLLRKQP
ncbi:MAG: hypothetical protein OEZ39_12045 [Gammaproteobacteria bacterium]|nr:hypothetical protein [Gammaproteobacteria bacterium]MDH5652575.1 hypothetical protein [Gammaproteobacteria bacterium]